jgi:FKBP-type peptidyl-prolyl cis-trans isomerase FklB
MKSMLQNLNGHLGSTGWRKQLGLCLVLLAGTALALNAASPKNEASTAPPAAVRELKTDQEKLSYALAMNLAYQLRNQSVEIDLEVFAQGLKDALGGGKTLLTEGEGRALAVRLQEELRKKQLAAQAEKLKAENEEAEQNRKDGEAFLAANKSKEGVISLPSGLQYKILKTGEGATPTLDDTVICHYRGMLLDGTEFDTSYKEGKEPPAFPVKGVIAGWTEALQRMPVGSKWQLFVPSTLAYGSRAAGHTFGPNSTLIFEVELLSIQRKTEVSMTDKPRPASEPTKLSKVK